MQIDIQHKIRIGNIKKCLEILKKDSNLRDKEISQMRALGIFSLIEILEKLDKSFR